jgi:NADH-quinone oxidoreductase subunit H
MGLFMLSEFIEIVVVSSLLVTLFFGGYSVPWLGETGFVFPFGGSLALPHLAVVLLQMAAFLVKVTLAGCFQIQIRWSLPRFRYDQLMRFGWQFLLPLGGLNLVATAVVRWLTLRG